ncbi:hypothetical protein PSEUDO8Z_170226 [Pseudomonas sp. 8Z]|nr:hypothetical protein PSEUDO8Z_170226 [Pseudomonas sp. 8Z]
MAHPHKSEGPTPVNATLRTRTQRNPQASAQARLTTATVLNRYRLKTTCLISQKIRRNALFHWHLCPPSGTVACAMPAVFAAML